MAERLDVPRMTVYSWRHRGQFPAPDLVIGIHPHWKWAKVKRWNEQRTGEQ